VRAEEDGVMLDFSSKFFLVSPSDPRYGPRIDEKISFFCLPSFLGRTSSFPQTKAKKHLKNRKGKKRRGERRKRRRALFIFLTPKEKKKRKFSLYSFSLFSLSLSLLVPHKDIHIHN